MKQLTDAERLEIAMGILDERQVEEYACRCVELELSCEHNGFHDIPAECEDRECRGCELDDDARFDINCPYMK